MDPLPRNVITLAPVLLLGYSQLGKGIVASILLIEAVWYCGSENGLFNTTVQQGIREIVVSFKLIIRDTPTCGAKARGGRSGCVCVCDTSKVPKQPCTTLRHKRYTAEAGRWVFNYNVTRVARYL